jgi:AcrR family transcriptional regulator
MTRLSRRETQALTRDRLRSAAQAEFAARGIAGSSLDRIAEAAGYTRGAFHRNYRNKHDLLLELVAEVHATEIRFWRTVVEQSGDADRLFEQLRERFDRYTKRRDIWMLGAELRLEAERNAQFGAHYHRYAEQMIAELGEIIAVLGDKFGKGPVPHPDVLAVLVRSVGLGLGIDTREGRVSNGSSPGEVMILFLKRMLGLPIEGEPERGDQS